MKHHLSLSFAALMLSVPTAWGQAFNVNFGPAGTTPPAFGYTAASVQGGNWTAISGPTAGLFDTTGAFTSVSVTWVGGAALVNPASCVLLPADKALLDDAIVMNNAAGPATITVQGLLAGNYTIYTYARNPFQPPAASTTINVIGSLNAPQTIGGGNCPLSLPPAQTYARHSILIPAGGPLTISIAQDSGIQPINGLQIVPGPPPGTPFCFGDGTGTLCPCANEGATGEGCDNSTGLGAVLTGAGLPIIASDSLVLLASNVPPGEPGIFFQGDNQINSGWGILLVDGLRCAGGSVIQLGVVTTDLAGNASFGPGIAAAGSVLPGDTKQYQFWYRDNPSTSSSPCGNSANLTNGWSVTWQ